MAPDSRLPVRPRPAGPRLVAPPGAGRVPPPGVGTGVRCGEPFVPGNGVRPERGPPSRPSRLTHVRVEPGAKPFVDDLLLGRGFVRSRAAPSLRSIESQPSTQGFVSAGRAGTRRPPAPARTRASGGVVGGASLSLPPPPRTRLLRLPTTACDLSRSSFPPGEGGPSALPRSASRPPPLPALAKPVWGVAVEVSRRSVVGSRRARIATARPSRHGGSFLAGGRGGKKALPACLLSLFSSFSLFLSLSLSPFPRRRHSRAPPPARVRGGVGLGSLLLFLFFRPTGVDQYSRRHSVFFFPS